MNNQAEFQTIVTELRGYLEFYRELGLTHIGSAQPLPGKQELPMPTETKVMPLEPKGSQAGETIPTPMAITKPPTELFGDLPQAEKKTSLPIIETLAEIRADIGDCTRCRLHEQRKTIVFGEGNPNAELMFVGEGPGADEDMQGRPFVGRSGQLLTKIIEAIGYKREDVYIANVVKCRPPQNRTPLPDETATCEGFLFRQLAVIKPKVIVALGLPAAQTLLKTKEAISRIRGRFFDYQDCKIMPTFHPAYLLRSPDKKREVWEDMKKVRAYLAGEEVE